MSLLGCVAGQILASTVVNRSGALIRLALCRYDPDEIEEEQRERERRNQINRQFSQFVKRVQQDIWERDYGCGLVLTVGCRGCLRTIKFTSVCLLCSDLNLEFEIPFRELGFFGVPARSTSFIMPTVNCLVELTEMPFTVITLAGGVIELPVSQHPCAHVLITVESNTATCRGERRQLGACWLQPPQLRHGVCLEGGLLGGSACFGEVRPFWRLPMSSCFSCASCA